MVESTAFGQRVFGDFKVEFGQCVRLATERYAAGIDAFHLHHGHALRKDAELFGGDIGLDSVDSLEIISGIDDLFGVDMTGVDREHFQTINALASYVEEHVEQ